MVHLTLKDMEFVSCFNSQNLRPPLLALVDLGNVVQPLQAACALQYCSCSALYLPACLSVCLSVCLSTSSQI